MAYLWNHGQPVEAVIADRIVAGARAAPSTACSSRASACSRSPSPSARSPCTAGSPSSLLGDESVTASRPSCTDRAFRNFAGTFVPYTIVLFAVLAVGFAVRPARHPVRRARLRDRANEEAAYFSGLRVKRIADPVHVSGTVAGVRRRRSSRCATPGARPTSAWARADVVTAALLGGVSIFGGVGTIAGVILALFLLGGIQKALLLSESISSYWIQIVTGALLIGSVLGPNLARRVAGARRRSRPQQEEAS